MPRERTGPNEKTGAGRPVRKPPNTGAGADWLAEPLNDPIQEAARQFALNLDAAIRKRYGVDVSGRSAAGLLGVDHNSLRKVLHGDTYPDLPFIVNAEIKLRCRLWPARKR